MAHTANKGIKYLWGVGKGWYQLKALKLKREKAHSFLQLVHEVLDPKSVMTKKRVRSFSKRARAYICAFYPFEKEKIAWRDNQDLLKETDAEMTILKRGHWNIGKLNKWPNNSVLTLVPLILIEGFAMGTVWN
jgi:hypothetical protein